MATINLAPETRFLLEQKRKQRLLFFAAAGIVLIVLLLWGGLVVTRSVVRGNVQEVQTELTAVETKISELDAVAKRIVLFERRSAALQKLLAGRISWDAVLKEMERLLPAPTILNRLSLTATGTVDIEGTTADLDTLAQTFASLKATPTHSTLFENSNLKAASRQETATVPGQAGGYNFTAQFSFSPVKVQPR